MQAIILAGGKGARLRPYTTVLPKPLMPVGDYPILEIIIRQLEKIGIRKITLAVGYLSELIEAYFGNGSKWNIEITYSRENTPLGTAGPLALIDDPGDNFIVMNGDILTTLPYMELIEYHINHKPMVTISMYPKEVQINLGVLKHDKNGNICDYIEKPKYHYNVSMGIYAFNSSVRSYIERNIRLDFPDLIKKLIENNETIKAFKFDGYWRDIGTPEDYQLALDEFDDIKDSFL